MSRKDYSTKIKTGHGYKRHHNSKQFKTGRYWIHSLNLKLNKCNNDVLDCRNRTSVMDKKWDERYSIEEFAYGEAPNIYLKEQLAKIPKGTISNPAVEKCL